MAQRSIHYQGKRYDISYESINPSCKEVILFLHGWGSNKEVMKQPFSKMFPEIHHIYVDMPGFGKSPNESVLTTDDYAKMMKLFCDDLAVTPYAIVGHSFGGKVAVLMDPSYLILLSTAGVPVKKRLSIRIKIALFKLLKRFGLGRFYKIFATKDAQGMNRAMYETLKNVVDEDFRPHFANFHQKCDIFWGEEDQATPLRCGKQLHSIIKGSRFFSYQGDHYFFLSHKQEISNVIAQQLSEGQGEKK